MSSITICPACLGLNRVPVDNPAGKAPVCGRCKADLAYHEGVSELNDSTLSKILEKSSLPVVVDFWAPWCGPCKAFAPIFLAAARELQGRFLFTKLDTQTNQLSGQKYQIRRIPTLVKFQHGREVSRVSGALPLGDLLRWVKE